MAAHTLLDTLIRPVFENLLLEVHGLLQHTADPPRDQQLEDNSPLLSPHPPLPLPPSIAGSTSGKVKSKPNLIVENDSNKVPKNVIAYQSTYVSNKENMTMATTHLTLPINLII